MNVGIVIGCLILLATQASVLGLCSKCLKRQCYENGECIIGCVPGYVGEYCNQKCPSSCLNKVCHRDRIDGTVTCTDGCQHGNCGIQCSENCPGDCVTCDRKCGSCNVTLCAERRYGVDCREICSPRFRKCDRETGKCIVCRRGYYGDNCNQKCTACFTRAETIIDSCLSGCKICQSEETCPTGFYGDSCELTCSIGCADQGGCNRATGECSKGCVPGKIGLTCNSTCIGHCLSGKCDRATGECSDGCVSGYHGLTCNSSCNKFCVGGICNQRNGICTSGCVSGYISKLENCESNEESQMDMNLSLHITLVCIGFITVVAVVAVGSAITRRRWSKNRNTQHGVNEPLLKYKKDRSKGEMEIMTAGMVRVSAVDKVLGKLSAGQRWITITGNAGDGKTTLGYLVLKESLQFNYKVFKVDKPEDYYQITNIKGDKIIMFDDTFGAFLADEQLIKDWSDVIRKLLSFRDNDIRVIFVSRKNVLNESRIFLGPLADKMFDSSCIVDLSNIKVVKERLNILEYHLKHENVTVSHDLKEKVCKTDIVHGFPHCCKMYSKLRSNGFDVDIEEFFDSPLMFLDMTTKVLYTESCKSLFQRMIKNDGQFDVYSVEDDDVRQKFLKVMMEHEGSYITVLRNGICQFAHPSVYESVLKVINEIDPLFCVQYATLSVIRQKMLISTSDEEDQRMSTCYIIVKPIPAVLKALAERFREDILKGDYSVFTHRLCESNECCEALISCCVDTENNQSGSKQYINQRGEDGETMLWTALKSGRMIAVHNLVKTQADVNIQDERGRTPLHYLFQQNTPAADNDYGNVKHSVIMDITKLIIAKGRGDVNIRDENGQTLLHYLCKLTPSAADNEIQDRLDIDTIRRIITEGRGDVNICDQYGQTPLHYLCKLMSSAANSENQIRFDIMRLIITEGKGDVNFSDQYGQTPLHYVCQLKMYPVLNDENQGRLGIDIIRLLIIEGKGDINIPDQYDYTPLHYLFKCNNVPKEEIHWIITEAEGNLNKCEQNKSTPLHFLCAYSDFKLDTVDLVITKANGDFNKGDEHGTTPLHFLGENEKVDFDVVDQIVNKAKGDINKQDNNGITPLHVLCKRSVQLESILKLINQGNKPDRHGNTPLHFLCRRRGMNAGVLQQLEQMPETYMKKQNVLGHTPLDYLTDKDGTLPWADGMICRSVADLVVCRFQQEGTWTAVLGPKMTFSSERVHDLISVEDFGRQLTNTQTCRKSEGSGQVWLQDTRSSSPALLEPHTYWEASSRLAFTEEKWNILLQMGLVEADGNLDKERCTSAPSRSVYVSVTSKCILHKDGLCIQVFRRDQVMQYQIGECVTLSRPGVSETITFTFGLALYGRRGKVAFMDVEKGKILGKVDTNFTQEVFPTFYVPSLDETFETKLRLISGREIFVDNRKRQLIEHAMSI